MGVGIHCSVVNPMMKPEVVLNIRLIIKWLLRVCSNHLFSSRYINRIMMVVFWFMGDSQWIALF